MTISPELLVRTAAKWNIKPDVALEVIRRDLNCVYCKRDFAKDLSGPRTGLPTWEHIINDLTRVSAANVALCRDAVQEPQGRAKGDGRAPELGAKRETAQGANRAI